MLVILYHIIDKKLWLVNGNLLPSVNKLTIDKKESIYDKYVINIENIIKTSFDLGYLLLIKMKVLSFLFSSIISKHSLELPLKTFSLRYLLRFSNSNFYYY